MIISDAVFGTVTIHDPIILDLLASPALQRLKGVMQHGITGLIGMTAPISRYEHSVGVMLCVRRFGASLEEQIAALLHDVSHTAFSHVIDYVFDDHDGQGYHDREKEAYVSRTTLPAILDAHGYSWEPLLDETIFSLLEQPSPALCADRLDYFLRDSLPLGLATQGEVDRALAQLTVVDGRLVCRNRKEALWLADTFMAADDASWSNFHEVGLYEVTARAIRRGLALGAIGDGDIWGVDRPVWQKLLTYPDPELQRWVRLVRSDTKFVWDEENPSFYVKTKIRTIDPDVLVDGQLHPLSHIDPDYAERRTAYLDRKTGHWPMRIVAKP